MASTWSSGSTVPQSTFRNMFDEDTSPEGLTFIDFLPECRSPGGFFTNAVYETFRSLVDKANDWLRANPQWEIKSCESVEFKDKGNAINSEKMIYLEYGEASTMYIRGLRLWISNKESNRQVGQQIGYVNIVPQKIKEGGIFSLPDYENLDEVIKTYNTMIRTQPIPGRIITIETQEMKVKSWNEIDPDKSSWVERGDVAKLFLYVIRIFFEITESQSEEIGIQDFVPDMLESGGICKLPKYELFSSIVNKTSQWCSRNTDIRICNIQSIDIKVRKGKEVDTQKTSFVEHGNYTTFYARILRVAYAKYPFNMKMDTNYITQITCKTFVPVQLTNSMFMPEFETLKETKARVSAWIKATEAQVISAETTALRIFSGGQARQGIEASFTFNRAERNEYWIFVIRVYINGIYREPPEEMLPPLPEVREDNCCVLL